MTTSKACESTRYSHLLMTFFSVRACSFMSFTTASWNWFRATSRSCAVRVVPSIKAAASSAERSSSRSPFIIDSNRLERRGRDEGKGCSWWKERALPFWVVSRRQTRVNLGSDFFHNLSDFDSLLELP